jgi:O-antigen/teichoic acid export membrane protein
MVGKCFLFLPVSIAQVLLPKVSAGVSREEDMRHLLDKSLLITGGVLLLGILAVWLLAPMVVLTLFGGSFVNAETLALAQWFGLAISPLALLYILLQYNLGIHNLRFMWLLGLDLPVLLLLLMGFHQNLEQVLLWVGINHGALFLLGYGFTPRKQALSPCAPGGEGRP